MVTPPCVIPELDEVSFQEEVLDCALPVFLHFTARGCDGCGIKRSLMDLMEQARGRAKCFCVDGSKDTAVGARFRVGRYPTILVFRHGHVTRRLVGHPLPWELELILRTELL